MSEQKVVLVSGATSGIGKATAELLAAKGYRVFGTSRDPAGKTGNGFELLQLDVTSDESVAACVRTVAERTGGRIDVLHNNAGTGIIGRGRGDHARGSGTSVPDQLLRRHADD